MMHWTGRLVEQMLAKRIEGYFLYEEMNYQFEFLYKDNKVVEIWYSLHPPCR